MLNRLYFSPFSYINTAKTCPLHCGMLIDRVSHQVGLSYALFNAVPGICELPLLFELVMRLDSCPPIGGTLRYLKKNAFLYKN